MIAFVVVALPQMAVWQAMFGDAGPDPAQGDPRRPVPARGAAGAAGRARLRARRPVRVASGDAARGRSGSLVLAFRDARYVAAVVPVLLAAWYLNASVFDWYHVRRFTGVVPLLAPGLAVVIAPIARVGARRGA